MKPFSCEAGFILVNGTIRVSFNSKIPLTTNYIMTGSRRHKLPRSISNKSVIFLRHGPTPFLILEGLGGSGGFYVRWWRKLSGKIELLNRFANVIFGSCDHCVGGSWLTGRGSGSGYLERRWVGG